MLRATVQFTGERETILRAMAVDNGISESTLIQMSVSFYLANGPLMKAEYKDADPSTFKKRGQKKV